MSPEIDMGTAGSSEHDGFYMLKKDSQRRTTLARVLAHDQLTLCKIWMSYIRREFGQSMLEEEHLEMLMKGLRDYITNQNRNVIEKTIYNLKDQLDFDSNAVHQLNFSLYLFQEAVWIYHKNVILYILFSFTLYIFRQNPYYGYIKSNLIGCLLLTI